MKKKILNNFKKLEWLFQIGLLILFLYLISYFAFSTNTETYKSTFLRQVGQIDNIYGNNPVLTTALILAAHLVVSFFSIPACAFINIAAGYLMGFWQGAGLIYTITMLSAVLGYFTGRTIYSKNANRWLWREIPESFKNIRNRGIIYLVLLRLSPFLPFGLLNLSLGYSKIPFSAYFASTFVGIFFDVVLLNRIGASFRDLKNTSLDDYFAITGFFIILFMFVLLMLSKKVGRFAFNKLESKKKSVIGTYEI